MDAKKLKNILEAGLLVAGRAMSIAQLEALFQHDDEKPDRKAIRAAIEELQSEYEGRGIELVEIASGFRLQSHESVSDWVANLFQEKTPRYSRALLETLVLIAYRQPITRAEIEDVRGVAVSSNIIKTLQERNWVKVLGHKEVPGKPALLGTTKEFLDYFNLKKLDELPDLADIKDLDQFDELLADEIGEVGEQGEAANDEESPDSDQPGDASADTSDTVEQAEEVEAADEGVEPEEAPNDEFTVSSADLDTDLSNDDQANDQANDEQADNPAHNETLSGAELDLLRVISEFSEEHQQEIDARDHMEAGIISKDTEIEDASDLSQRMSDEPGDLPSPGDTLH